MSITGSLMGYENNNEVNQIKCSKKSIKTLPMVSTNSASSTSNMASSTTVISSSTTSTNTTTTLSNAIGGKSRKYARNVRSDRKGDQPACNRGHANGLWSVWYGIMVVTLQAYVATRCAKRFVAYLSLPWPADAQPPKYELHTCIVLTGTGVLLLPILLAAAFLKLGNLANDGIKLGRHTSTCTRDPPSSMLSTSEGTGLSSNLWKHGGPTAAFVHLCTAMCFLLPSLLMEARLIQAGFLPKEAIWRTDLDWVVVHRDRLVFFSFMNPPRNLSDITTIHPSLVDTPGLEEDQSWEDMIGKPERPESIEDDGPRRNSLLLTTLEPPALTNIEPVTTTVPPSIQKTSPGPLTTSLGKNNASGKANYRSRSRTKGPKASKVAVSHENMTGHSLPLTINSLADLDHPEHLNLELSDEETYAVSGRSISLEYLNYAMALGVYSVRYPAVFWSCNKALGTIFSVQLVINSAQSLLSYAGMSVLYKIQVIGPHKVLPLMRQNRPVPISNYSSGVQRVVSSLFGDNNHFLLNPHVTLALFGLSSLLVLCSSMVTYLYAYGRFASFLEQERERRIIMSKEGRRNTSGWAYFTHCAALCVFLALAICNAPLLYDYTVVYRGSLDGVMFACILGTLLHLFLSIVLWFFLTVKRNWVFKVRVTIARATVRSARSVKLVTDVDLLASRTKNGNDDDDEDEDPDIDQDGGTNAPLLVVGDGKTYSIAEASPKRAIMSVIQRAVMERKAKKCLQSDAVNHANGHNMDSEEQIYWLRPKLRPSPAQSPTNGGNGSTTLDKSWLNKKLRPKVTFNDLPSTSGPRNKGKRRGNTEGGPDDDGDYATLRELPLMATIDPAEDSASEENKLLECVNDDQVTYYASGNHDLQPSSEGDLSPFLPPEPLPDPHIPPVDLTSVPSIANTSSDATGPLIDGVLSGTNSTLANHSLLLTQQAPVHLPRCLRHADSTISQDQLTPRSDSSNSPATTEVVNVLPSDIGLSATGQRSNTSSNSECSSGIHSTVSNGSHHSANVHRRATSVDDLSTNDGKTDQSITFRENQDSNHWRSCSLQRGSQPPNFRDFKAMALVNPTAQAFTPKFPLIEPKPPGCPAIILESANESTVVIRRRSSRPKLTEPLNPNDPEPFSRSTNMRMTSFTEGTDFRNGIHASSATLPHYPTQPVVPTYPHCSTMPLSHGPAYSAMNGSSSAGGSCTSVPQQALPQQNGGPVHPVVTIPREHTTLPSHQNGLRLPNNGTNGTAYVKRFPPSHVLPPQSQQWSLPSGHHTFPQPLQNKFFNGATLHTNIQIRQNDRDSANFSMASSGDSDICLQPH